MSLPPAATEGAGGLRSLIEQLESASEGTKPLGEAVLLACGWTKTQVGYWLGPRYYWTSPDGKHSFDDDYFHRHNPTTSLDAAITLVPEGWAWKVGTCCVSDDAWVVPDVNSPIHGERLRKQFGDFPAGSVWDEGIDIDQRPSGTPAIALCRAVLEAREAINASEGPREKAEVV